MSTHRAPRRYLEPILRERQPLKATFVRAAERGPGTRVLEWRSDATGRVHEVLEANSDRLAVDLSPGDAGLLWFAGGKLHASERLPPEATRRLQRRKLGAQVKEDRLGSRRATRAPHPAPAGHRLTWLRWALPLLLLGAVAWQLLAANRP